MQWASFELLGGTPRRPKEFSGFHFARLSGMCKVEAGNFTPQGLLQSRHQTEFTGV